MTKKKNLHSTGGFQKAALHGSMQGFGPFRPRPKRLDAITLPSHHAPGDLQKEAACSASNTTDGKGGTGFADAVSTSDDNTKRRE